MSLKVVQRIGFGAIAIWLILVLTLADAVVAGQLPDGFPLARLLQHGSFIPVTLLILALAAARELLDMLARMECRPHRAWAMVMISLLILQPWVAPSGSLGGSPQRLEGLVGQVTLLAAACVGTMMLQVLRREPMRTLRDAGGTLLAITYLGFLPAFALLIRCGVWGSNTQGPWVVLTVILVTKCSDIGGYLVGSTLGRHKLIPAISPGKSWEGLLGGIVLSAAVACGFTALFHQAGISLPYAEELQNARFAQFCGEVSEVYGRLGYVRAALFGAILAVVALIGDLFESCLKREAQVKDSGSHIPTYGGILDLLDSPCAALPAAWFLLTQVWGVV